MNNVIGQFKDTGAGTKSENILNLTIPGIALVLYF
jgi:hypothetical protein